MLRHLTGALALTVIGFGSATSAQDLVIAATGGTFEEVLKEAYITPFQEATGLDIAIASQNSTVGPLKAQVEAGNVKWDVVYLAPIDSEVAKADGLIQAIDYGIVNTEGLRDGAAESVRPSVYE